MAKHILSLTFALIFVVSTAVTSVSFELNGYWKSDQKYPLNLLQFDEGAYHYGKYSQPAKIYKEGDGYAVQFTKFSKLFVLPRDRDSINVTFPDPSLPKNIQYTRVKADEAAKILRNH